ncbi:MAG: ATPase domain-containing protein [Betaproteobacteria bacterium]
MPKSISELAREHLQLVASADAKAEVAKPFSQKILNASTFAEKAKERMFVSQADEPGLRLPWSELQDRVRITPGKLAIWTGYQHHGKTQMLKQVMLAAMQQSENVLIASMEEDLIDVWCDMARMACGTQEPSPSELNPWLNFSKRMWLYDEQGQAKQSELKQAITYAARNLNIKHFVIDSLMTIDIDKDDYNLQTKFVREIRAIAKAEKITVHLVAHMRKREGKLGDGAIGNAQDISGPHEISSLADYIFVVWREMREIAERPPNSRDAMFKVEKQRGRFNWIGSFAMNFHSASRQFVRDNSSMKFWDESSLFDQEAGLVNF